MTVPNFGGQPNAGQQFQGWSPGQQPAQQPTQPQQQSFNPQTTVVQSEPHVQMPAPYFPPPQQPQQPPQQQGNQLYPNAPQYAPAWQGGQQIQQQPVQGQPFQQNRQAPMAQPQQQQQPAPAQNVQFDQHGRMFGAGLPQELQGKTMQEAVQIYGMMRQGYTAAQQQRPQQQQQQQQQPQQTPTQQGQVQAGAKPSSPWTDPEGFFGRLLDEKLGALLGPVVQRTNEQDIAGVRDDIAARYPQYQQYEAAVLQRLEGLPIETLKNPQAWELALSAVVGEQMLRGGGNGQQQQQQRNNGGQAVLPWQNANQGGWQQQNQPQQHQSFFTESPSAVMQGGMMPGDQSFQQGVQNLSSAQLEVARRFGITPAQYAQGMGVR